MPPRHILLALLIVAIWGINFVAIKLALAELPPIMLGGFRFIFAAFPAIFFIKLPKVSLPKIIAYGITIFALQFAFLFSAMFVGASAGLSSLLLQIQVIFTILFSAIFLAEIPNKWQIIGGLISFIGLGLVIANVGGEITFVGLILIICAAASWGLGNIISKKIGKVDMLSIVVWGSLVACPPLLILSFILESESWKISTFTNLSISAMLSVAYIVYPSTLIGYSLWSWLLSHHRAAIIAPFTLLVPIFGFGSSAIFLNEPIYFWKLLAGVFIISGLIFNIFGKAIWNKLILLKKN